MFTLGIRIWTGKEMAYPSRFSVLTDIGNNVSSMRTYINDVRFDSKTTMLLTPGVAVNGEIYELDIISPLDNDEMYGVVEFEPSIGGFVAIIDGSPVIMNSEMEDFEIIGNIFENWDEYKDKVPSAERFEALIETNKKEVEEAELLASQKRQKEKEKAERAAKEKEVINSVEETPTIEETENAEEVHQSTGDDKSEETSGDMTNDAVSEEQTTEEKPTDSVEIDNTENNTKNTAPESGTEENNHTEESDGKEQPVEEPEIIAESPAESAVASEEVSREEEAVPENEEIELPENNFEEGFQENELSPFGLFGGEFASDEKPQVVEEPEEPVFTFDDEEEELINIKIFIGAEGQKVPAKGSYSYIMQYGEYERVDSGVENNTTKQRMELTAIITALSALNTKCNVKICTTSQYIVVPFIKGWITRWRANNWKKESNDEIKNKDLWSELYELYAEQNIEWEFIKPGSSIVEILRCIDIAKEAILK